MESDTLVDGGKFPLPSCKNYNEAHHFVVLDENGRPHHVSLPQEYAASIKSTELCFKDHRTQVASADVCCLQDLEHVHPHVHRGKDIQDILLEQCIDEHCMEKLDCALPVLRELSDFCQTALPVADIDHEHREGCGHSQIRHGDHFDWLVPLNDGSFSLSHPHVQNGLERGFIEHGRLINRGKTLAKLKLRPTLVDLFSYESPKLTGYESLPQCAEDVHADERDGFEIAGGQLDKECTLMPFTSIGRHLVQEGMTKVDIPAQFDAAICRTKLDVMGICCPSEVPLIKKLLAPLTGVKDVTVNATAKSVLVLHDPILISDIQLVKVLNGAHLDASIHQRGKLKAGRNWPSPWCIGSGILLALAFLKYVYEPLHWVALGAVAVGVPPVIVKATAAVKKFHLDINILMLIAVSGAIALQDYLEAGTIVFLFTLADWLESRSTLKARLAIASVVDRAPQNATLADGGMQLRVEEVAIGTSLSVKTGETIPIDGEVQSGRGLVDESSLTGESVPVEKETGATVWAGTINLSGYLTIKTTALSADSAVARMVKLVEEAQHQRSNTELLVEKIAKYYTPGVVIAALIVGIAPWASGVHNPGYYVYLALVLLVVACPCALVISTPLVVTCGIAQAARLGLLVKGGTYLEILGRLKVMAFDKTGTLTEGQFCVHNMLPINGVSTLQEILYWATSVENKASHPLAAAIVMYARLRGVEPSENVANFEVIAGEGVAAEVDGHTIHIGNARMADRFGWDTGCKSSAATAVETLADWSSSGATVGWVGLDGIAIGIFSVGDKPRTEAAEAVRELKKLGIRVAMLTGDSNAAAIHAQNRIGEMEVNAELIPEDKVRIIKELKHHGIIAMVGDGINDAPALATADVGIAMGVAGSAVAMETADVSLMTNDLRKLAAAVRLGLDCRWKIAQNIIFSFMTKLLIIGLVAGGYASLWGGVVADVGTCLIVVFNSRRLLKKVKHQGQDHCVSERLAFDKEIENNHSSCCTEGEGNMESKVLTSINMKAPVVSHKHKVRFSWLHKHHHQQNHHHDHHHQHHHHEKKEKCEEEDFCCTDKEYQPPCCSSARCEKIVLTSRGKGHKLGNNAGGFDKTKGERISVGFCESQCCSNVPSDPTVQIMHKDCDPTRKCLPEETEVQNIEFIQMPRASEKDSGCCSDYSCNSRSTQLQGGLREKDSCEEKCEGRLLTRSQGMDNLGYSSVVNKEQVCEYRSSRGWKHSTSIKNPFTIEVKEDANLTVRSSASSIKTYAPCCSSESCNSSSTKILMSLAAEVSKDSDSGASVNEAVKSAVRCCSNSDGKSSNCGSKAPPANLAVMGLSAANEQTSKAASGSPDSCCADLSTKIVCK